MSILRMNSDVDLLTLSPLFHHCRPSEAPRNKNLCRFLFCFVVFFRRVILYSSIIVLYIHRQVRIDASNELEPLWSGLGLSVTSSQRDLHMIHI